MGKYENDKQQVIEWLMHPNELGCKPNKIEFTNILNNEKILTEVINLHKYKTFEELYKHFDKESLGYNKDDIANPKDMEKYYSIEEQNKYGVLGIEIKIK